MSKTQITWACLVSGSALSTILNEWSQHSAIANNLLGYSWQTRFTCPYRVRSRQGRAVRQAGRCVNEARACLPASPRSSLVNEGDLTLLHPLRTSAWSLLCSATSAALVYPRVGSLLPWQHRLGGPRVCGRGLIWSGVESQAVVGGKKKKT